MCAPKSEGHAEWLVATKDQLARKFVHDLDFLAFARYPFFRRHTRVVMDVGANRGQSIASFLAVLPGVTIHAFEPNPLFHRVLMDVAADYAGSVHVYPVGLGRDETVVNLYLPAGGNVSFFEEASMRVDYFDLPWVKQRFVERGGLTLDVVSVNITPGDHFRLEPDVIKIDVEGAESDVLAGLRKTLDASCPVLLVENSDWHRVTSLLAPRGYSAYRFIEPEATLVPFFGTTTNTFYIHESQADRVLAT